MQFLWAVPLGTWLLAALVPVGIFALYFLKLKRKPLVVSSTYLWRKSLEDLRVNSLWQRLRRNLLLWLQLLAAGLALLALLRPATARTESGTRRVFLIDNSASMSAIDVAPSRLDLAKRRALERIDQMSPGDAAMVIAFADAALVRCSYTADRGQLRRAIEGIEPTARITDIAEALTIAAGLANPERTGEEEAEPVPATVLLFSDGNFPRLADFSLGNLRLEYNAFGTSADNVAITALAPRASEKHPDRVDLLARVHNFGTNAVQGAAELTVDGRSADLQRLTIPPGAEQPILFRLAASQSSAVSVRWAEPDLLSLDNEAWAVIEPPRPIRVLVIGPENLVLKAVLSTKAVAQRAAVNYRPASFAQQDLSAQREVAAYDVVILDRCLPKGMPGVPCFLIGAVPAELVPPGVSPIEAPAILNWKTNHPILRFLDLDDVSVARSMPVLVPKGADRLIESNQGPLLLTVPRGVHTDLIQTFPLVDDDGVWRTDWPLRLSFPLYMLNVLKTLGRADEDRAPSIRPGQAARLRAPAGVRRATVRGPDGSSFEVPRQANGDFEILATERLGLYSVQMGAETRRFAVNLFDERESSILPAPQVDIGSVQVADSTHLLTSRRELWKWATLAAFGILLAEWYIYAQRVSM